MTLLTMEALALNNTLDNKRLIIRVDLNVPIENGKIQNDSRIRAILPTIRLALEKNARIILLSHLGQPKDYTYSEQFSLKPIALHLEKLLQHPVRFEKNWLDGITIAPREIVLCENVRFNPGEMENDPLLAKKMAALGDIFIMDAFGAAHRAQASTVGIAEYAPIAAAGLLLSKELTALEFALKNPKRPLVAIVAGAKVSSKLPILQFLIQWVDVLILGGGIANTFLAAEGHAIGSSLYEPDLIPKAREIMEEAAKNKVKVLLPVDVVLAKELSENAKTRISSIEDIPKAFQVALLRQRRRAASPLNQYVSSEPSWQQSRGLKGEGYIQAEEKIGDVGPKSIHQYEPFLNTAGTILWNGPIGIFELSPFSKGTEDLAHAIANSKAFSIAGGGETLAAIEKYQVAEKLSYISTGGGAFLEYLEGKTLPAVAILEKRAKTEY